jgi:hypothetical protein
MGSGAPAIIWFGNPVELQVLPAASVHRLGARRLRIQRQPGVLLSVVVQPPDRTGYAPALPERAQDPGLSSAHPPLGDRDQAQAQNSECGEESGHVDRNALVAAGEVGMPLDGGAEGGVSRSLRQPAAGHGASNRSKPPLTTPVDETPPLSRPYGKYARVA